MDPSIRARIDALSPIKRAALERLMERSGSGSGSNLTPGTGVERMLAQIWELVLGCEGVLATDNFLSLGGDSITSVQVVIRAEEAGLRINARQVIEAPSLRQLASIAEPITSSGATVPADESAGAVALTPIQHWFFAQDIPEPHRWDQVIVVDVLTPLDQELLETALRAVVVHHDVLRSRFTRENDGWVQIVTPAVMTDTRTVAVRSVPSGELDDAFALAQQLIELDRGPLVAAVLLDNAGLGPGRLLLAIHHLVVDGVSMRILIDDLDTVYRSLAEGGAARLPTVTTSFRRWSEELHRFATSDELVGQLPYWASVTTQGDPAAIEAPPGLLNVARDSRTITMKLSVIQSWKVLHEVSMHSAFSAETLLIAALLLAWKREQDCETLTLDLESHGREPISPKVDVSRTVGWFTSIYPVCFELPQTSNAADLLDEVAQTLHEVPMRGLGYGVLKYLVRRPELSVQPSPAISFNYLGRFDSRSKAGAVFGPLVEAPRVLRSEAASRAHVIDVTVSALGDELSVTWEYASKVLHPHTASTFAESYVAAIGELADAVLALPAAAHRVPS